MIQDIAFPKRVVFFSCLTALISILLPVLSTAVNESLLIDPAEISLTGAIPIAILAVTIGILVVILCARSMLGEALVVFLLLISLEFFMASVTAVLYHLDDEQWLHQWAGEAIRADSVRWDYSFLLGALYSIFGSNLLIGKVINGAVTALLPFLVFKIARTLFGDWAVPRASFYWCCSCIPLLLYGAFSMKESLTAFFLTAALGGLALAQRHALAGWSFAIFSALILAALRPIYSAIVISAILTYQLTSLISRKSSSLNWLLLAVTLASCLFFSNYIVLELRSRFATSYLEELQHRQTFAGQMLTSTNAMEPSNLLVAGLSGIYFPPPIKLLLGSGDSIEAITMLSWYIILPFFVFGIIYSSRSALRNAIGCAVLVGTLVASISIIFAGVAHRHRVPLLPLMCIMAGNSPPTKHYRRWLYGWCMSVLVLNCLYWYLRGSLA